ncbi:MAG: TetM/TetW/TetO/TetS family tetracycline resistance ribosomal protection protein [Oscillospiraceae bacterium]|nr:TetM/TetW/TetO/TetS family tetracycline resistance ribosomal protection protein [Oscillospiraceae bacterium]
MKKIVLGILAHVDAGKTTLSEALLHTCGAIRTVGRVDHGNAFLDTDSLERARGITIFSKQALFSTDKLDVTLMDTPGHSDFSAEMERALQVLDCAILVISNTDGVQAHTETLWRLLRQKHIPTFIFINKTDLPGLSRDEHMVSIKKTFGDGCVDFSDAASHEERAEAASLCDERLLDSYLEKSSLTEKELAYAVRDERLFPCYFGSALKLSGVTELIKGLELYAPEPVYSSEFGAKVCKIARDAQGNRMTYLKITGGSLKVRDSVTYHGTNPSDEPITEKISQIRLYSGAKYEAVNEAFPGSIYAVLGLSATWPGQGIGAEEASSSPIMEPVVSYRVVCPDDCDPRVLLPKLKILEEESPHLHVSWNEELREIRVRLMGEVETEVFCHRVDERFGVSVSVDSGRILYRETIEAPVEGVGHFEPLRHYAEVHLMLEPADPGSGLIFRTSCSEDILDKNWQRLILTHLEEKQHRGVLTGSPITDMKITLIAGRSHAKHTEGGDFRQATYRAVRQGLMKAKSVLLEPINAFKLEVPFEQVGRAITDLHAMGAEFSSPEEENGRMVLTGRAPLSSMQGYTLEVASYTHGLGRLFCEPDGYAPCKNAESVIAEFNYEPERDLENTPDSVFCSHGAGVTVKWDKVEELMHLEAASVGNNRKDEYHVRRETLSLDDKVMKEIIAREFGSSRSEWRPPVIPKPRQELINSQAPRKNVLIVDAYNVIFAWDELRNLASSDLDAARERLLDILSSYCGYQKCEAVIVFDAYKVTGNEGKRYDERGLHVVYTREGETGDLYIERMVGEIGKNDRVRVVTSDGLIQLSAIRSGVLRVSAREFESDVRAVQELIAEEMETLERKTLRNRPLDKLTK